MRRAQPTCPPKEDIRRDAAHNFGNYKREGESESIRRKQSASAAFGSHRKKSNRSSLPKKPPKKLPFKFDPRDARAGVRMRGVRSVQGAAKQSRIQLPRGGRGLQGALDSCLCSQSGTVHTNCLSRARCAEPVRVNFGNSSFKRRVV